MSWATDVLSRRASARATRAWPLAVILALLATACGTTVVRQVEAGDRALARGDYRAAEQAYDHALRLDPDEEGRGAWARAKIDAGRARVRILRARRERPWERFTGSPPALLDQLHALRISVRNDGGDAELEATLDRLSDSVVRAFVTGLEAEAARALYPAALAAVPLPGYDYLDHAALDRADALVTRGRERAELDAVGVGDQRPLARRVYQMIAARLGGAALTDARALTAAYGVSVARTVGGVACGGGLTAQDDANLAATRRATVEVVYDTCRDDVTTRTMTEAVGWTEEVISGYREEVRSYQQCTSTPTDYYQCTGSPPTCSYSGSLSKQTCQTLSETVKLPIYETLERTGVRELTVHQGTQAVTGRWTVTRDGRSQTGTFGTSATIDARRGPAYEHFPPLSTGALPTFAERVAAASAEAERGISAALATAFRPEIDRAEQAATALERTGDEAATDEAWTVAVLLGSERPGTWARHGLTPADVRAAFATSTAAGFRTALAPVPAPRVFELLPLPRRTPQDVAILEQRMIGPLGKDASVRATMGWQAVPEVTSPLTTDTLAGQGFVAFGAVVESQGLLSRRRRSQLGFGLVDGVAGFLGGGMAVVQPETSFGSSSLLRAGASYTAGLALRHPGTVGLLAGLRADGEWFLLGNASGWHARVGGFARLELLRLNVPWTFAAQVEALDLVGDPLVSGELFLARVKKDGWERMSRFFSLRYERRAIDAGVTVTGTSEVESPTLEVEDLEATSWTLSFGLGF